jgi:hypothetical protein
MSKERKSVLDVEHPEVEALKKYWWNGVSVDDLLERIATLRVGEINALLSEMKAEQIGLVSIVQANSNLVQPRERRNAQLAAADLARKMHHVKAFVQREHQMNRTDNDERWMRVKELVEEAAGIVAEDEKHSASPSNIRLDRLRRALGTLVEALQFGWRLDERGKRDD